MHLSDALANLGLSALPSDAAEIKRAWRQAAFRAHPDRGGSQEAFTRLQDAMEVVIERMAHPPSGYGPARHGTTYSDRLALGGPVSPAPIWSPPVDLRTWWRDQAMLELNLAGLGHWTREGVMRGGILPARRKTRR